MLAGARRCAPWTLAHMRQTLRSQLAALPPALKRLDAATPPPVTLSQGVMRLTAVVDHQFG